MPTHLGFDPEAFPNVFVIFSRDFPRDQRWLGTSGAIAVPNWEAGLPLKNQ